MEEAKVYSENYGAWADWPPGSTTAHCRIVLVFTEPYITDQCALSIINLSELFFRFDGELWVYTIDC